MPRDIFRCLPAREREEGIRAYAAFLAARDGEPDFDRRILARREATMERMARTPVRWSGQVDPALFAAQYRRFDRSRGTPREVLLLLTFLKINANEAYAVEQSLLHPESMKEGLEQIERITLVEEVYHTRLLLSAGVLFDVAVATPSAPTAATRGIVAGITRLPGPMARPVTFCGEVVGILTLLRLLAAVTEIFRDDPPLRDALDERAMEVLVDEIGHLSFNRLLLGPAGLAAARALLPVVALGTRGSLPEAEALGVLPLPMAEVGRFEVRDLPAEALRRAFVA
jgi:hypothetical protein